jgi:N-acetylmuramoyl-L-alanine amidase
MTKSFRAIVAHWAVTKYKCDATSRLHYHFIYEGDGTEVVGNKTPEANLSTGDGDYAAHTKGFNTGVIGVSCAAMFGANSSVDYGKFPITQVQFEAMCRGIARLCKKYGIPVTPQTVLSHAEVQTTLGIKQNGKWDISVLPFAKLTTAKACGDLMRIHVTHYLNS